jgi:peptidylprolyl isomerase
MSSRRIRLLRAFSSSVALAVVALAAAPLRAENAAIVGRAGSVAVSETAMRDFLAGLSAPNRDALSKDPKQAEQWLRGKLLDLLVLDDAAKAGFDKSPDVQRRLARAHDALIIELYLDSHVDVAASYPSEAEARAFYEANKAAFIPPKRYRLAQIFIADPSQATSNAKADDVARRAKAKGANFAALARELSDAKAEAAKGGEIGWLGEPNLAPEIRSEVEKAKKGAIVGPIRMKDGWHVVLVLDAAPAATKPLAFELVADTLSSEMRRKKIAAEKQSFIETLLKANPPSIDEKALGEALAGDIKR